jgi:hypothetical protein
MPKIFVAADAVLLMAGAAAMSTALAYEDRSIWLREFNAEMTQHIYTIAVIGILHLAGGVVLAVGIRFFKCQPV